MIEYYERALSHTLSASNTRNDTHAVNIWKVMEK